MFILELLPYLKYRDTILNPSNSYLRDTTIPLDIWWIFIYVCISMSLQLKPYALFRKSVISEGLQDSTLIGYARFFNATSGQFVRLSDEDNGTDVIEVLLMLSVTMLELLVTITLVATVHVYYDHIVNKYHKIKHSRAIFFFRSFFISELLWSLVFMGYIIEDVIVKQYHASTAFGYRIIYYTIGTLGSLLLINIVVTIVLAKFKFKNDSDIQVFCVSYYLGHSRLSQAIAFLFTLTVSQLLSFFIIFLCLSFVITPPEAGATILLYAMILLSLVTAIAAMLTIADKKYNHVGSRIKFVGVRAAKMVLLCFLLLFVIVFGYSFLELTIYAGDTETGGITSVTASLVPSALLAGLAWLSKRAFLNSQLNDDDQIEENIPDSNVGQNSSDLNQVKKPTQKMDV